MARKIVITDARLKSEVCPTVGDLIIRDAKTIGFGVRLSPGSISFFAQGKRDGKPMRRTIGRWSDNRSGSNQFKTAEAREIARDWLQKMRHGGDPYDDIRAKDAARRAAAITEADTFGKAFREFITLKANSVKEGGSERSVEDREYASSKLSALPIWKRRIDAITVADIDESFRDLSPSIRIKLQIYGAAAYEMAATSRVLRGNPFRAWRKLKKPALPPARAGRLFLDTVAGKSWLAALLAMRGDADFGLQVSADYIIALLFWGTRRNETARLLESDFRLVDGMGKPCHPHILIRAQETKSGVAHVIPVTPWMQRMINQRLKANREHETVGGWLFPSVVEGKAINDNRKALLILNTAAGLAAQDRNVRNHDLRRAFASHFSQLTGGDQSKVGQALGHSAPEESATFGYAERRVWAEELRPFYEAREHHILAISGIQSAPPMPSAVREYLASLTDAAKRAAAAALLNQ